MRRRYQNNAKLYEYKIVSNCIGGGCYVNNELIGTVPDGGELIYQSSKKRLDTVYIRGGVPMEDRQEIDSQVDTTKELLERDSVVLTIALTTSPHYGFRVSVIAPDEFTLRTTNRINRTLLITSFTPPAAIYGVNFGDPIVLNYDSYQHKMPDFVIDGPHDRIVRADPNLAWAVSCADADFTPLPYPESWFGQGLNSVFLPEMTHPAPGDHHVSYTAYIYLDLIDDGGSKVHTEYLILKKTLNFTI
jgi:hypothetical protein